MPEVLPFRLRNERKSGELEIKSLLEIRRKIQESHDDSIVRELLTRLQPDGDSGWKSSLSLCFSTNYCAPLFLELIPPKR